MILSLRFGFLSNRVQKMAIHVRLPRRCLSHRSYLFAFAALCLMGLTLVALLQSILGRQQGSLVEYVVVGADSHRSILRLNRSQISIRRIELLSFACIDCSDPQVGSGSRPIIGVFLVQETIDSSIENRNEDVVKGPIDIHGSVDGVKDLPEIQESVDGVKDLLEIQGSVHKDNDINGPLDIHKPIQEDDTAVRGFFNANERRSGEKDETVETFINCDPAFDYAVYVVLRSEGTESISMPPSEDWSIQSASPWIDRLLRRTTEECRKQRVNITVWLTTISSDVNVVNALNDVFVEAYFDNVTWYDLLIWSDRAQRSHVPLKWAKEPTEVLARTKNVGVVTSGGRRLFIHRRHYEIFGHFFPIANWTLDTAVRYLLRLYSPQWSSHQRDGLNDLIATTNGINETSRVDRETDVVIANSDGHDATAGGGNRSEGVSDKTGESGGLAEIVAFDSHLLQRYVFAR